MNYFIIITISSYYFVINLQNILSLPLTQSENIDEHPHHQQHHHQQQHHPHPQHHQHQQQYENLIKEIFVTTPNSKIGGLGVHNSAATNRLIESNLNGEQFINRPSSSSSSSVREEIATEDDCAGGNGVCVPFYLCHNNTVVTDGTGFIDDRFGEGGAEQRNKKQLLPPPICTRTMEICCKINKSELNNLFGRPSPPAMTTNNNNHHYHQSNQMVGGLIKLIEKKQQEQQIDNNNNQLADGDKKTINLGRYNCGYRNFNHYRNIDYLSDSRTKYGEFPWMIIILIKLTSDTYQYQCGGSLIHPSIVLTAAHCIANVNAALIKVRAGEWDTQNKNQSLYPHQDRSVFKIIVHEQYDRGSLKNDIGLLFLDSPVQLNDHINVICLPPEHFLFDNMKCLVSGWGKDDVQGKYNRILRKIYLPILSRQKCQMFLRKTRLGRYFELNESFLCAGGEQGRDTCKGDGGSPLICEIPMQTIENYYQQQEQQHQQQQLNNGLMTTTTSTMSSLNTRTRFFQAGIVSWGIGCGTIEIPAVYVNVGLFRKWIDYYIDKVNIYSGIY